MPCFYVCQFTYNAEGKKEVILSAHNDDHQSKFTFLPKMQKGETYAYDSCSDSRLDDRSQHRKTDRITTVQS